MTIGNKDPHYYDTVLNNGDVESIIISHPDLRYPAAQLARDGGYLAPEAFTRDIKHCTELFAAVADLEQIQSEYRAGTTVALAALQRLRMPVQELCAALKNYKPPAISAR